MLAPAYHGLPLSPNPFAHSLALYQLAPEPPQPPRSVWTFVEELQSPLWRQAHLGAAAAPGGARRPLRRRRHRRRVPGRSGTPATRLRDLRRFLAGGRPAATAPTALELRSQATWAGARPTGFRRARRVHGHRGRYGGHPARRLLDRGRDAAARRAVPAAGESSAAGHPHAHLPLLLRPHQPPAQVPRRAGRRRRLLPRGVPQPPGPRGRERPVADHQLSTTICRQKIIPEYGQDAGAAPGQAAAHRAQVRALRHPHLPLLHRAGGAQLARQPPSQAPHPELSGHCKGHGGSFCTSTAKGQAYLEEAVRDLFTDSARAWAG